MHDVDPYEIVPASIIDGFPAADLELVQQRRLQRRADSKFLIPERGLAQILEPLAGKYAVLYAADQAFATYRTLYFDTPGFRAFHDHRRGRRPRYKVRIRHYDDRKVSFLEIKMKRSQAINVKYRDPREFGDHELVAADRDFVNANSRLPGSDLEPVAWTNFLRLTLLGLEFNERVTVDLGLEFVSDDEHTSMAGVGILEVKQSPFCVRTPIMQAVRRAGYRPGSASKYCSAIAFTRDPGRKNRLLPTFRAIERLRT